jgi:hypothetical protein
MVLQRRLQGGAAILEARKPAQMVAFALANEAAPIVWAVLPRWNIGPTY